MENADEYGLDREHVKRAYSQYVRRERPGRYHGLRAQGVARMFTFLLLAILVTLLFILVRVWEG